MFGVLSIFKSSSRISTVNIFGGVAAFLANIVVARRAGPEVLGMVGLVDLWLLYAGLARPGLLSAAYREMLHLTGSGKVAESERAQNVALTYEGALVGLAALVLAGSGAFYGAPLLRVGMVLAGVTFVVQSLVRYHEMIQWAHQRFALIAGANLVNRLMNPVLNVVGVLLLGGYGLLLAPILTALGTIAFYRLKAPPLGFRLTWDGDKAKALLRLGLPLTAASVLYWGFRTADRAMVAGWLPLQALGMFAFAIGFIDMGLQLSSDFYNVLQVKLLTDLGRLGQVRPLTPKLCRLAVLTTALACFAANLAQAGFGPVVQLFLPKFTPSIVPFNILVFNLAFLSAPMMPSTLLTSALMQRQTACAVVELAALAANVAMGAAFVHAGWGLEGIALSSAVSMLLVCGLLYSLAHRALFEGAPRAEAVRFYAWLAAGPALCMGGTALMAAVGAAAAPWGPWGVMACSVAAALALWSGALALVHREWWAGSTAMEDILVSLRERARL